MINIKRVYEAVSSTDGMRLLVERLWPRGVKKTSLKLNGWPKDVLTIFLDYSESVFGFGWLY